MAIDKLSGPAGLMAALRAELSQRKERTAGAKSGASSAPAAPTASRDPARLRQQLVVLAQAVDVSDPAAVNAARPQFVRAMLLWEFGPELRDHPDWQPMLESITQTLENHPGYQAQFLKLLSDLKR